MVDSTPRQRRPVAVLGATGLVGQRLVSLLADHPWFECAEVAASQRSAGRRYADAVDWRVSAAIPEAARELQVLPADPDRVGSGLVFSALDASVAGGVEAGFAAAGRAVVSNARSHRMDDDVPLVIPEVNAEHLALLGRQRAGRGWGGYVVTNPNCSVIALALALAPLDDELAVERVVVTSLQAVSGAGYPGVAALDVADNVVPGIPGEEAKIEAEPRKILGALVDGQVQPAPLRVSAHTHRVGVSDGHLLAVSVETRKTADPESVRGLFERFRGEPQELGLPSAPRRPIVVARGDDRPQPRLDRGAGGGMAVTVGRIRPCAVLGIAFEALGHNTVRGAAGGTLLIAELLAARGLLP